MHTTDIAIPERALAIGAHPDDIEFGAGSTLAKWASQQCEVSLLICTDGSKGSWDPSIELKDLIATRKSEQLAAAEEIPAKGKVIFLGCPDGELQVTDSLRKRVARIIRELKPNVILGHDPWKRYRLHPDHRAAGYLTVDAVVAARDPFFYPEQGLNPHRPSELLLYEAEEIDHYETCNGYEEKKIAALLCHVSQYESTMGIHPDDDAGKMAFRKSVVTKLELVAEKHNLGTAEGFKRISNL